MDETTLKKRALQYLIRQFEDVQMARIRTSNRMNLKKNGELTANGEPFLISNHKFIRNNDLDTASKWEKDLLKEIQTALEEFPIWTEFLKKVKGIGPTLAGWIISEYDIYRADTVSKLWAYTGLAPGEVYGEKWNDKKKCYEKTDILIRRDKLTPGFRAPFNKKLRSKMAGVLATEFLKQNSVYRIFYDNYKNRLENESEWEEEKPGHRNNAARRYMIKQFLIDLYVAWRTLEGLPMREPYQNEYLDKSHGRKENHDIRASQ